MKIFNWFAVLVALPLLIIAADKIVGWFEGPPRTVESVMVTPQRVARGASFQSNVVVIKQRECPGDLEHQILYAGETAPTIARQGVNGIAPLGRVETTVAVPIRSDAPLGPARYQIRWEFFCSRGNYVVFSHPIMIEVVP